MFFRVFCQARDEKPGRGFLAAGRRGAHLPSRCVLEARKKSPAARPGFGCGEGSRRYFATRRFESLVPIWLNTVTISEADVRKKNLLESLAQYLSRSEGGSLSVVTWTV